MADVITLPLSQLSLSELQERLRRRQEQREEFSRKKTQVGRIGLEIAEKDIEDIKAEWKHRSTEINKRMRAVLHVVPSSKS